MSYPNIRYRVSPYPDIHYTPMVALAAGTCEPVRAQDYLYISWFGIPLPDYSFAVEPEAKERKIDEVMNRLRQGVESIQNSQVFREFLMTMAKFHDYSIGNQILIMIQKPAATQVAGFNTWKDMGRFVKAGEKGIAILAPCFAPGGESRWIRNGTEWAIRRIGNKYGLYLIRSGGADVVPPTLLEPLYDTRSHAEGYLHSQGAMRGEERALMPASFKVVYVFDIAQTQGKELPKVEVPTLSGEVNEDLFTRAMALAKKDRLTVEFNTRTELSPEVKGMLVGTLIWVKSDEPRAQQLKTLLHEEAHYYTERVLGIPRADAETIAESSAFVVAAHFGFDTGTRSFPYVAIWSKDKAVLEKNLAAIRGVSTRMIAGIEATELSLLKEQPTQPLYMDMGIPVYYDKGGYKVYLNVRWPGDPEPYQVSEIGHGRVSSFATVEQAINDAAERGKLQEPSYLKEIPVGNYVRVTYLEGDKRKTLWAKKDIESEKFNLYIPVDKEGGDLSKETKEGYELPKILIDKRLIVKEEPAHIDRTYGELRVGELPPPPSYLAESPTVR